MQLCCLLQSVLKRFSGLTTESLQRVRKLRIADAFFDGQSTGSAPRGPYWRHLRRVTKMELLTAKRLQYFQKLRTACVLRILDSVINECKNGKATEMDEQLYKLLVHNITGMTLGETYFGRDSVASTLRRSHQFFDLMATLSRLATSFVVGDYFPFLRHFDILGYEERMMKAAAKQRDAILENILVEHEDRRLNSQDANQNEDGHDFVDVLLTRSGSEDERPLTRSQMKALLQDGLIAGMDTSATLVGWIFTELLRHPSTLKRAQEELDTVVGHDRLVEESDISRLPYMRTKLFDFIPLYHYYFIK